MPGKSFVPITTRLQPEYKRKVAEIIARTGETKADFMRRVIDREHRQHVQGINPYREQETRLAEMLNQITEGVGAFAQTYKSLEESVRANVQELIRANSTQKLIMAGTSINARNIDLALSMLSLILSSGKHADYRQDEPSAKKVEDAAGERMRAYVQDIQLSPKDLWDKLLGKEGAR